MCVEKIISTPKCFLPKILQHKTSFNNNKFQHKVFWTNFVRCQKKIFTKNIKKPKNLRELGHTKLVKNVSWSRGVQVPNPKSQILNPKSLIPGPKKLSMIEVRVREGAKNNVDPNICPANIFFLANIFFRPFIFLRSDLGLGIRDPEFVIWD